MAGILFFSPRTLPQGVLRAAGKTLKRSSSDHNLRHVKTFYRLSNVGNLASCSASCSVSQLSSQYSSKQWFHFRRRIHYSPILCSGSKDVVVPPFADSVSEGDVRWQKKVGDSVAEDETICEIETDKTSIAVPAPGNGVIEELYVAEGTTVKAKEKLFRIKLGGEAPSKPAAAQPKQEAPAAAAAAAAAPPPPPPAASAASGEAKDVVVPPFADSVSEGDVRWEKKVGDAVAEDETVCQVETDKTSIAVPAPGNGVIEELYVAEGTTVKAKEKLFRIRLGGAAPAKSAAAQPRQEAPAPAAAPQPTPAAPSKPPPIPKAPKASTPPPPPRPMPGAGATVKVPPSDYSKKITGTRTEQRVKMNRMRQRIAERLKDAQNTNAMLTTFNEIDMGNIMEFRKQHMEKFQKKYGMKLGFMSAFVKASAYALQEQPVVNAVIDPSGTEIIYRDYVDISVAVATPKGLVVPVLRNVESMNYADIEMGINELGEKARKNALAIEDMDGGTFTISNGGVFGSLLGTPIINPPQSSILGMHGTFERPVARNGQVVIRPMMYVALTYDHRLIDGREAVMFLRKIKDAVEDPRVILAGL